MSLTWNYENQHESSQNKIIVEISNLQINIFLEQAKKLAKNLRKEITDNIQYPTTIFEQKFNRIMYEIR